MSHSVRIALAVLLSTFFAAGCDRGPSMVGELPTSDEQPVSLGLSLTNESSSSTVDVRVWIDGIEILAGPLDAGDGRSAPRPHHEYQLAADAGGHVVEITVDGERLRMTRELTLEAETWLVISVWDDGDGTESSVEPLDDGTSVIHREPGLMLVVQGAAPAYL